MLLIPGGIRPGNSGHYGQGLVQSIPIWALSRLCPCTALGHIKWPNPKSSPNLPMHILYRPRAGLPAQILSGLAIWAVMGKVKASITDSLLNFHDFFASMPLREARKKYPFKCARLLTNTVVRAIPFEILRGGAVGRPKIKSRGGSGVKNMTGGGGG